MLKSEYISLKHVTESCIIKNNTFGTFSED